MAVAVGSLVIALGGTAWAAGLPRGSVGTKQLRKDAVTTAKLSDNAVTATELADGSVAGAEIAPGAVGGAQVDEAGLGKVPAAAAADTATRAEAATLAARATTADSAERAEDAEHADRASTADGLAAVETASSTVTANNKEFTTATAHCPPGHSVTGGGYSFPDLNGDEMALESYPLDGTAWRVRVFDFNDLPAGSTVRVYALCVAVG